MADLNLNIPPNTTKEQYDRMSNTLNILLIELIQMIKVT